MVQQQVVALGDHEPGGRQHHQRRGQWLFECAVESRRVHRRVGFHGYPLEQLCVARGIEGVRGALAVEGAEAAKLFVGQVEAVHRDVRGPAGPLALADTGQQLLDQCGLACPGAPGDAEDGARPAVGECDGVLRQPFEGVGFRSHADHAGVAACWRESRSPS